MTQDRVWGLEEALVEARAALVEAETDFARHEVAVANLRVEVAGLEAAIARRGPITTDHLPLWNQPRAGSLNRPSYAAVGGSGLAVGALVLLLMETRRDWATKKRASAVELVLMTADQPVHRTDITEALRRVGRTKETIENVSAALAYLKTAGRAEPLGDGYWKHVSQIALTGDTDPTSVDVTAVPES
ncbi:MAG: hypothetical protein ACYDBS_07140, partial [Acidimicrobiales bacterium]